MAVMAVDGILPFEESGTRPAPPRRLPAAGSVVESAFVRRTRTLLRTAPLHGLATKTSWQGWDSDLYDPRVLALAAIDAVVARMGFSTELTYDDAIVIVADLARLAAPEQPEEEHLKVAGYVLDGLLNDRDNNNSQAFSLPYSDYRGDHKRRELRFFLLVEKTRSDGCTVLEASVDAVNAFRGGLDLDVTDAQMAMELVLRAQLERGDLAEAEITAEHNQRLSYEMSAKIRSLLDQTRSDVRRIDWESEGLAQLARARTHVKERIRVEEAILTHLSAGDDSREENLKDTAHRVGLLLEGCLTEHRNLHERLMGANDIFLGEQHRQALRRRGRGVGLFAVRGEILDPTLETTVADGAEVGDAFVEATIGAIAPGVPRLAQLVAGFIKEGGRADANDGTRCEEEPPDLSTVGEEGDVFPVDVVAAARRILAPCSDGPRTLSSLLGDAATDGPEVEELVRLSVLWAFAPEHDDDDLTAPAADVLDPLVVAVPTGAQFTSGNWTGDDFLVGSALVLTVDQGQDDVFEDDGFDDDFELEAAEEVVG